MHMRIYDLIIKKRNGGELATEEINYLVSGYTNGKIPDYQMSAMLMAIYFRGMNPRETADLTMAMVNSGDILDLSLVDGVKADKHSTGGVGDKVSLVLGPMAAAVGMPVAKMSGRGLGHTGGTIDKLESIPGFITSMEPERFISQINAIKIALTGQTGNLTPADKKIYALRDTTATVESIPLIASSIMSKKIAAGADVIVLDVKCGSGAFMKTQEEAEKLASLMVGIGKSLGRKTTAVITDMDEPLGHAVGNANEVIEAIETLKGRGSMDVLEVSLVLGSWMLVGSGMEKSQQEAYLKLKQTIDNKSALNKFREWITAQGGDAGVIDDYRRFPQAKLVIDVNAPKGGYINHMDSDEIGMAAMVLGAGREKKGDNIDPSVGIDLLKKTGDYAKEGEIIAKIYANDENRAQSSMQRLIAAYTINETKADKTVLIKKVIQ